MIPELGHFALILALLVALVQGVVPMIGAARRDGALMALARAGGARCSSCSSRSRSAASPTASSPATSRC